jgi:hypothetical protein
VYPAHRSRAWRLRLHLVSASSTAHDNRPQR